MTAAAAVALSAKGIEKEFVDGERKLRILSGLDLEVHQGEFVSIVGQSGSGKSTLLHILGALDRPTRGTVNLGKVELSGQSDKQLARLRSRHVGFVFQFHHLLPEFTALENVLMPGLIGGLNQGAAVAKAEELLRTVGLGERLDHRPAKLSGGEQQRVAIARALLNDPDVVLADEPTGNLDTATSRGVLEFLLSVTSGAGKSLVMVTHDPDIARRAHRMFYLRGGALTTEAP
ncbi:ATP-binding cassette domain-containing protein [bacterium]|nr:ATP-binding cassette domain-containing protein [bacterium]